MMYHELMRFWINKWLGRYSLCLTILIQYKGTSIEAAVKIKQGLFVNH